MKHMILPLLIVGLFLYAVAVETDLIVEKDKRSSRVIDSVDVIIEPEKSDDSEGVKEAWDSLMIALDDVLMDNLGLKREEQKDE